MNKQMQSSWWQRLTWPKRLLVIQAGSYVLLQVLDLVSSVIAPLSWWDYSVKLSFYPEADRLWEMPLTALTYILPHQGLLHLVFNLLLIYYLLPTVDHLFGSRRLLALYLGGAFFGAVTYLLLSPLLAALGILLLPWGLRGCSAAVLGAVAAACMLPEGRKAYRTAIPWWLLLGGGVLLLVSSLTSNLGGTLAHLGGILWGATYGLKFRRGKDILAFLGAPPRQASAMGAEEEALRTKLRHSGYASLTDEERTRLRDLDSSPR